MCFLWEKAHLNCDDQNRPCEARTQAVYDFREYSGRPHSVEIRNRDGRKKKYKEICGRLYETLRIME